MFTSKVMFIVAIVIEATLLVSSITLTKPVIAKKASGGSGGGGSGGSGGGGSGGSESIQK